MELIVTILASGSAGNSVLVEAEGTSILLDAGLSYRELVRRARSVAADLSRLSGIFVSHEHTDHITGIPLLARNHDLPVFLNKATHEQIMRRRLDLGAARIEHFETGDTIQVGPLAVRTFSVTHDAADPVGFVICRDGFRLGVVTDVGHGTRLVEERLRYCDALIIESNHDPELLESGPYPPELKRRIRGKMGHLSNDQCAELLGKIYHLDLRHVFLAHLSERNNTPGLAYASASRSFAGCERPPAIMVASQAHPVKLRLAKQRDEAAVAT